MYTPQADMFRSFTTSALNLVITNNDKDRDKFSIDRIVLAHRNQVM